jgi:hypothetical protein
MKRTHWKQVLACLAAVLLVALAVHLVGSVSRTITDIHDNQDSLIRNSNGKYWELSGSNVQAAIDDLSSKGGTVWVGGNITLSSAIKPKSYVMVDFQNSVVTLASDVPFVNVTACRFGAVKNVKVQVSTGHTSPVILLYVPPGGQWADRVRYMTFENIQITNPSPSQHEYTGIRMDIRTSNMAINTFRNIQMENCKNAIHLKSPGPTGWGNGNYFDNIWADGFETLVWFDGCGIGNQDFNHNVFESVNGRASSWTKDGFKNINGQSNHFDQCGVSNWEAASSPNYDWSVASSASTAYVCAHYVHNLLDNGHTTRYCNPALR